MILRLWRRARNELDFVLRQAIRWRRPGVRLPAEKKDGLFGPAEQAEVHRLVKQYGLEEWERQSGRRAFAASLFYLQMMERALTEAGAALPPGDLAALDAGCGDWFYVSPQYRLLERYGLPPGPGRRVALDGVELDAWCLYPGFRARIDWAEAYAAALPAARYLPVDVRAYDRAVDVAFMMFPFIFEGDLARFGRLPPRYLRPAEYLAHVWGRVRPGGWLVIASLGPEERAEQHRLLAAAGMPLAWWSRHDSPLFGYQKECYVSTVGPKVHV